MLKKQTDFKSRNDYVDYLFDQCELDLSRELIYGRIQRNWGGLKAITTPRVTKPAKNHPYKRQYDQEKARRRQVEMKEKGDD